jgi:CubicO group peptidase (beta-lactamase class C family)
MDKRIANRGLTAAFFIIVAVLAACGGVEKQNDSTGEQALLTEPAVAGDTAWWWYDGATADEVASALTANNARLVSLRVESATPLLFDAVMVENTGPLQKTNWWWYFDQTAGALEDLATANDAKIVDVEPYSRNGTQLFAAIMEPNVGQGSSGWWWYSGKTQAQLASLVSQHNARIVDLREHDGVYSAVMISNTGAHQTGWWWYLGVTAADVTSYLQTNGAYLASIDPADANGTTFNVVMNALPPGGFGWWWYYGKTQDEVMSLASEHHARIVDLKSYVAGGTRYFDVILVDNAWNATQQAQAACDANVVSSWKQNTPPVGLGSAKSAAAYDAAILKMMTTWHIPGGAIAVMNNGKLVMARGYGLADAANGVIAHPDSRFRIASLTKQITSAAVLKLVQEGKMKLSDKPFASGNQSSLGLTADPAGTETSRLASITVSDLLHHTGGWSPEQNCTGCGTEGDPMFESQAIAKAQKIAGPPGCDQIIRYMMTQPVHWAPGTTYDYSNFGYCTLGAVIEKVTGTSYQGWVTSNVLAPAGASGIVQGRTLWPADREVEYYDYAYAPIENDVFEATAPATFNPYGAFYLEAMAAHGAWVASPIDLLRFQGALDGRTGGTPLLSSQSISEMIANPKVRSETIDFNLDLSTNPPNPCNWYGFGWAVGYNTSCSATTRHPEPNGANTDWNHVGSLQGTLTVQFHGGNGWGWAAFFNSRPADENDFANQVYSTMQSTLSSLQPADWLTTNLFDQYGAYSSWMTQDAFESTYASQIGAGKYAPRIEGYNATGTPLYRATFVPYHASATSDFKTDIGVDCSTYTGHASQYAAAGYAASSLQSYVSVNGTRRYQATWVKW